MLLKSTHLGFLSTRIAGPAAVCREVAQLNRRPAVRLINHLILLADLYRDAMWKLSENKLCHDIPES